MFDRDVNVVWFGWPSDFSPAQQAWFSTPFDKLGTFKIREWGFFDHYAQFTTLKYFLLVRYIFRFTKIFREFNQRFYCRIISGIYHYYNYWTFSNRIAIIQISHFYWHNLNTLIKKNKCFFLCMDYLLN